MNIVFCKKGSSENQNLKMLNLFAERNNYQINTQIFEDAEDMLFKCADIEYSIDVLFLDVKFPKITGFEVVERFRKNGFRGEVIFLTAIPDQWDKAFDVHAYHYILDADCTEERFVEIVSRVMSEAEKKQQETVIFTCAGERVVVPLREIKYFSVNERWITVHYGQQDTFEFFARIGNIEQRLIDKGFTRIHRAYVVSVRYISSIKYNQVILQDGTFLRLARGKYPVVKELFERYEGLGEVL